MRYYFMIDRLELPFSIKRNKWKKLNEDPHSYRRNGVFTNRHMCENSMNFFLWPYKSSCDSFLKDKERFHLDSIIQLYNGRKSY